MSEERRKKILSVGMELFLHYGYRRTTIGDIAAEARISRPTLYGMYKNKEAIFAGVVEMYMQELELKISQQFDSSADLSSKLNLVLNLAVIEPFSKFENSTVKRELLAIDDPAVTGVIEELTSSLESIYARCFEGHDEILRKLGRTPKQLGRMISAACHGMKERAQNLAELKTMLATLVTLLEVKQQ